MIKNKKNEKIKNFLPDTLIYIFSMVCILPHKHGAKEWTKHHAKKWFQKKEWLDGLQLQPHKTINKPEFARQYHVNKVYWDKAFTYLKGQDLQALAYWKISY